MIRLFDEASQATLVISSFPNDLGGALAQRMADAMSADKDAGSEVMAIRLSATVLAGYSQSASEIKLYIAAARSSLFITLKPVGEVNESHRRAVEDLLKKFTELPIEGN